MIKKLVTIGVAATIFAFSALPALAQPPNPGPDNAVCIHASGTPGLGFTNFITLAVPNAGSCTSHP